MFAKNLLIKNKFDQRTRNEILIGYHFGQRGYRTYNIESKIIRHKMFFNNIFTYKDVKSSSILVFFQTQAQCHVIGKIGPGSLKAHQNLDDRAWARPCLLLIFNKAKRKNT